MLAKLGNSDAPLTQAIKDGDVYIVREKGRDYYAFKTLEVTRSTGVKSSTTVKDSEVELSEKKTRSNGQLLPRFRECPRISSFQLRPFFDCWIFQLRTTFPTFQLSVECFNFMFLNVLF